MRLTGSAACLPLPGGKPTGITAGLTPFQQRRSPADHGRDGGDQIGLDSIEDAEGLQTQGPPWRGVRSLEQGQLDIAARQAGSAVDRRQFCGLAALDLEFPHPALFADPDQLPLLQRHERWPLPPQADGGGTARQLQGRRAVTDQSLDLDAVATTAHLDAEHALAGVAQVGIGAALTVAGAAPSGPGSLEPIVKGARGTPRPKPADLGGHSHAGWPSAAGRFQTIAKTAV